MPGDDPTADGGLLFAPGGPPVTTLALDRRALHDRLRRWQYEHPTWGVLLVRGSRSRDREHFFDEAASALDLPGWFGGNWDAFADCLTDLSWLPRAGYLLVVPDAHRLLRDSPADRATLLEVLQSVTVRWAQRADPVTFATLLVTPPADSSGDRAAAGQRSR